MIDSPQTPSSEDDFDELVAGGEMDGGAGAGDGAGDGAGAGAGADAGAGTGSVHEKACTPARTGVAWALAAAALAVLGVGALAAAAFVPLQNEAAPVADIAPSASASPSASPTARTSSPVPSARQTGAAVSDAEMPIAETPIAELADPEWIAEVAAATEIPERALASYAGVAIEVATSDPSCGIGWNTLAAIGFVESEHGSIGGSVLGTDGAVSPAIVGIALDGSSTDTVTDTDGGSLDGDAIWDHAVGPMQFIPSTWALAAQDGNRDGTRDINQIDDAALAAAVHLCDVGGDLTVAENWIAAVAAYNPSVDYNNRVADAATHYATTAAER